MQRLKALSIIVVLSLIITGGISSDLVESELTEVQDLSSQSSSFLVTTYSGLTSLGTESMTGMAVSGSNDLVTFRSWESLATDKSDRSTSTGEINTVTWTQQTSLNSNSEANSRKYSGINKERKRAYIYPINMSNHFHTLHQGNISLMAVNGLNKPQDLRIKVKALQKIDYNNSVDVKFESRERRIIKVPISTNAKQDNYIFKTDIGTYDNTSFQSIYSRNFVLGKMKSEIEMYLDGGVRGCVFTPSTHFSEWERGDWLVSEEKSVCSSRNKELPVKFEQVNFSTDFSHKKWSGEEAKKFAPVLKYRVDDTEVKTRAFNNSKASIPERDHKPGSRVTYWVSLEDTDTRSSRKGYHVYSAEVEANKSRFRELEEFTNRSSLAYSSFQTTWDPGTYFEEFKSRLTPDLGGGPVESSLKTTKFVYKRLKLGTTAPKDLDEVINYLKGLNARKMWIIIGNKPFYSAINVLPDYPDTGYKVVAVFEELNETAVKQHKTAENVLSDGKVNSEDSGSLRRLEVLLVHEKNQVEDAIEYIEEFEDTPDASKYTKHPLCGGKASIVVGCPSQREISMVRNMSTQTLSFLNERREMLNQSISKFEINYTYVDADSPVDVHVYGPDGNHYGPVYNENERVGFERQIPGVSAFEVNGTVESVMIHSPRRDEYRIEVVGRENGSYDLEVEKGNLGSTKDSKIEDIPTREGEKHNISVENTERPKHQLEINTQKVSKADPGQKINIPVNLSNSGSETANIEVYSSSGQNYVSGLKISPDSSKTINIAVEARNQSWDENYSLNLIARSKYDLSTTEAEVELNTEPNIGFSTKNISIDTTDKKELRLENRGSRVAENILIRPENDSITIEPSNISYLAPKEEFNVNISIKEEIGTSFISTVKAESIEDTAEISVNVRKNSGDQKDQEQGNSSDDDLINFSIFRPQDILQTNLEQFTRSYERVLSHEKLLEEISSARMDYRREVSADEKFLSMETARGRVILRSNSSIQKKIYQNPRYRVTKIQNYKADIWRIKASKGTYYKEIKDGETNIQNSVYNQSTVEQRFQTLDEKISKLKNVSEVKNN